MIATCRCLLRKNGTRTTIEHDMHDSHGLAVGNEYRLDLDGYQAEWTIIKLLTNAKGANDAK